MTDFSPLYGAALQQMDSVLDALLSRVPPPKSVLVGDAVAFRFGEKSLHQAIVQKLARIISGLSAASLLLDSGFLQEHGAIQRMLDEFHEDAAFLSFAAIDGEETELHRRYLTDFYQEEFKFPENPLVSHQKRAMIPRQKIRAYLANRREFPPDPSTGITLLSTIGKTYSGYIHGASPHIMEMYGGKPSRFHTRGMRNSPLFADHEHDIWNYYYRSLVTFAIAAKAFGDKGILQETIDFVSYFEQQSGDRKDW